MLIRGVAMFRNVKNVVSTNNKSQFYFLVSLLFLGAAALASSGIAVRISEVPPTESALYRVLLAIPLLWMVNILSSKNSTKNNPAVISTIKIKYYCYFVLSGVFLGIDLFLWHWSITFTSIANANLFANMSPIIVFSGAMIFFKEKIKANFIIGFILAFIGAGILLINNYDASFRAFIGDILGLATAVFYGAYILTVGTLRKTYGTFRIMFWSSLGCLLVLLPLSLILNHKLFLPIDIRGFLALLSLAVVSHVGGQGLVAYVLARLPASFSSVTLLVQPIFAAIFALFFFGEKLGVLEIGGCMIILCGIFLTSRAYKPKITPNTYERQCQQNFCSTE